MQTHEEFDSEHQKMRGLPGPIARLYHVARRLAGHAQTIWFTVPPGYHRAYGQNTSVPIRSITSSVQNAESAEIIAEKLKRWRDRKLHEFQFVQVAVRFLSSCRFGQRRYSFHLESCADKQYHIGNSPRSGRNRLLLMEFPDTTTRALAWPGSLVQQLGLVHHGSVTLIG